MVHGVGTANDEEQRTTREQRNDEGTANDVGTA
jgi:hypothetical protein